MKCHSPSAFPRSATAETQQTANRLVPLPHALHLREIPILAHFEWNLPNNFLEQSGGLSPNQEVKEQMNC